MFRFYFSLGRGPVLGAMVYGAAWCDRAKMEALAKLGFADSKQVCWFSCRAMYIIFIISIYKIFVKILKTFN